MEMVKCPVCSGERSSDATPCPHCGNIPAQAPSGGNGTLKWLVLIAMMLGGGYWYFFCYKAKKIKRNPNGGSKCKGRCGRSGREECSNCHKNTACNDCGACSDAACAMPQSEPDGDTSKTVDQEAEAEEAETKETRKVSPKKAEPKKKAEEKREPRAIPDKKARRTKKKSDRQGRLFGKDRDLDKNDH